MMKRFILACVLAFGFAAFAAAQSTNPGSTLARPNNATAYAPK